MSQRTTVVPTAKTLTAQLRVLKISPAAQRAEHCKLTAVPLSARRAEFKSTLPKASSIPCAHSRNSSVNMPSAFGLVGFFELTPWSCVWRTVAWRMGWSCEAFRSDDPLLHHPMSVLVACVCEALNAMRWSTEKHPGHCCKHGLLPLLETMFPYSLCGHRQSQAPCPRPWVPRYSGQWSNAM